MNPFLIELENAKIGKKHPIKLKIEDNVGEAIHIHYGHVRLEYSIDEFKQISREIQKAAEELDKYGNCN